jgi:hypothetical protein
MTGPVIDVRLADLNALDLPLARAVPAAVRTYLEEGRRYLTEVHRESRPIPTSRID